MVWETIGLADGQLSLFKILDLLSIGFGLKIVL